MIEQPGLDHSTEPGLEALEPSQMVAPSRAAIITSADPSPKWKRRRLGSGKTHFQS